MARTAVFVYKHGRQSEIVLRVKQGDNPTFGFLMADHRLHPYFQYLVDHPQILKHSTDPPKEEEEEKSKGHDSGAGALSLLGSVYGTGDDDDGALKMEIKETETLLLKSEHGDPPSVGIVNKAAVSLPLSSVAKEKKPLTVVASRTDDHPLKAEMAQSIREAAVDLIPSILEPPSFLRRTIEKIVEFIARNGKQFEAILIDQDKNIGRFPFLLSTNQYHSYYLKILDDAFELKLQGKDLFDQKSNAEHHGWSKKKVESHVKDSTINGLDLVEFSEGGYYDLQRKDKFKMTLVGQKKDSPDQTSKTMKQSGLSADEAAAIVLAATRGASPGINLPQKSTHGGTHSSKSSGATTEEAAAIVMAATRGRSPAIVPQTAPRTSSLGSLSESKTISRFVSDHFPGLSASTGLSGSIAGNSRSAASDVTVATVIAKSVALVASREADSSEAGLSKEQKLKAERLKRAKMFAALIKTGDNCTGELATPSNRNTSMDPPSAGDSVPIGMDSYTLRLEREGSSAPFAAEASDREYRSRRMHRSQYRARHDGSDEDIELNRKKHCSSHRSSSKDEEARRRRRYCSSPDDEHSYRKSSEHRHQQHRNHRHSSDDEDREPYEKKRRGAERRRESDCLVAPKFLGGSEGPLIDVPDVKHPSADAEIPNDLRAKIRAMLLETL